MSENTNNLYIRPTTSVYATYRRLSYKAWYAIAEFVDNSTQSYFQNKEEINANLERKNKKPKLKLDILYNNTKQTLTILDNAYGMEIEDFKRALILDSPPLDGTGRSEFGMGLKTAACWFGSEWTVETTQLGSKRNLTATIDVKELTHSHAESILFYEKESKIDDHYTKIIIKDVHQPLRGKTISRVHEQLSSIYRQDLKSGEVEILWNGVPLSFESPEIYEEFEVDGTKKEWKEELDFSIFWPRYNKNLKVRGWVGIRKQGKQRDAGFVLLRRQRVILGGPGEGYKPSEIFGQANSFRSQRLTGELHLDEWPVTQAKDNFDWFDGLEDALIDKLQELCKTIGDKAETIRANQNRIPKHVSKVEMEAISKNTKGIFRDDNFSNWIDEELKRKNQDIKKSTREMEYNVVDQEKKDEIKNEDNFIEIRNRSDGPITYVLNLDKVCWTIKLFWQNDLTESYWMGVGYPTANEIHIYLNLSHLFFASYINDTGILELLQKFVISIALAEKLAIMTSTEKNGNIDPYDLRMFMNKILTKISLIEKVEKYD